MNFKETLLLTLGGLGMFLFGMRLMSEGLQKIAGNRLRHFLDIVSSNRFVGAFVGMSVTALVQSSSLTTVTVVGFVNAGLMSLSQGVGIILGANVGTTITAQIIAFKISHLTLIAIFFGVCLKIFSKRRKWKYVGEVILGFGLLFYGMDLLKSGFKPLRTNLEFIAFFTSFDVGNLLGVFICVIVGAMLTLVLQSSSATVGITIALASQGILSLPSSIALILGENIGTTITGELAAIGGTLASKRAARAHTLFNVIGVFFVILLFDPFLKLVIFTTKSMGIGPVETLFNNEKINISRYIANSHTLFNMINASFFLLIFPFLIKVAMLFTRVRKDDRGLEEMGKPRYLDKKYLDNAGLALTQVRDEIVRMSSIAQTMFHQVTEVLFTRKLSFLTRWRQSEQALDNLRREIIVFLVQIRQGYLTEQESYEIASLMRMANNIERLGDSIENMAGIIEEMIENNLTLTPEGIEDYREIRNQVANFIELVLRSMRERSTDIMDVAQKIEDTIDEMRERMRDNHVTRLRNGTCTVDPGLLFVDMLSNFEKMGDYLYNVAQAIAGVR